MKLPENFVCAYDLADLALTRNSSGNKRASSRHHTTLSSGTEGSRKEGARAEMVEAHLLKLQLHEVFVSIAQLKVTSSTDTASELKGILSKNRVLVDDCAEAFDKEIRQQSNLQRFGCVHNRPARA